MQAQDQPGDDSQPSRGHMEGVLGDWGVLPEGPGALADEHLERRFKVFSNIDF